ncbi:MAG: hypothetical protein IJM44_06935 [Ruminococcus sp.]|nr:hypothetical protein [Ruminococcus sp.]
MNKHKLFEAMSLIDDDLVNEASAQLDAPADERDTMTVSGVDVIDRPWWRTALSIAAVAAIAAGIGFGGAAVLKARPPLAPEGLETAPEPHESCAVSAYDSSAVMEEGSASAGTADSVQSASGAQLPEEPAAVSEAETSPDQGEPEEDPTEAASGNHSPGVAFTTTPSGEPVTNPPEMVEWTASDPNGNPISPAPDASTTVNSDMTAEELYTALAGLDYSLPTCDCLPEYTIGAPDGTVYYVSLSEKWARRAGIDTQAVLPDYVAEGINYLMNVQIYGGSAVVYPSEWNRTAE